MSNEVTVNQKFLVSVDGDKSKILMEELDGLGMPSFEFIKMPSGGGLAFEVPSLNPENPDLEKEISGVIVDHHPINAFWREKFAGGNERPDCQSMDGKQGIDSDGCLHDCTECPQNKFGSDGAGKACKNMHRIYVLRSGEMLPMVLTLPPTSLKGVKDYIQSIFTKRGLRPIEAVTKISLKKEVNADNIAYSKAVFSLNDILERENIAKLKEYSEGIKKVSRTLSFNNDEYMTEGKTTLGSGAIILDGEEEIPFPKESATPVYEEYNGEDYTGDYEGEIMPL